MPQPYVTEFSGNRKFSLRFDCADFKPEEIQVKTRDKTLCVHAEHNDESPGRKKHVEFTKTCSLPEHVDPLALKSTMSRDGVLHIEAPVPNTVVAQKEFLIPIDKM